MFCYSETLQAAKQSTITIGTEPHVCIKIENHETLFMVNMASSRLGVPNDYE